MKCTYKTSDKQCDARALKNGPYCFFHASGSENEAQRLEAQSRGGKANLVKAQTPLPPMAIGTPQEVVKLLEETINSVRGGELDVRVANCIGVLSGHLLKAMEVSTIATRVEIIERAILERRTTY